MSSSTGLVVSFVAAIQASLSVLLVIFYGGLAAWLGMLNSGNTKAISKVCVRMFLPALLFTKIGAELHAGSAHRYGVIVLWALLCHLVSFVIGIAAHLLLGMPDWTTVAIMFNNTTSYPLLLVAALDQTGILRVLVGADESTSAAIERAKSYFLVFSTISSCLTFAVGPRLIDSEHAPEPDEEDHDVKTAAEEVAQPVEADTEAGETSETADEDEALYCRTTSGSGSRSRVQPEAYDPLHEPATGEEIATEHTGLLAAAGAGAGTLSKTPSVVRFSDPFSNSFFPSRRKATSDSSQKRSFPNLSSTSLNRRVSVVPRKHWVLLGPRTKWWLLFLADFFNAPMLGALAGAVVGLTPSLHTAFFADVPDGGIFTAWLTSSLDDIGSLFVPLPVVVAGVSLYTAMQETRQNTAHATENKLPWGAVTFILVVRFVLWPIASVATIYAIAVNTGLVSNDPMLWFALMLMPTGPPAMKLITLVQVSDADTDDETSIAKLLTISYLISPILAFTVVGSLQASQAAIGS